MNVVVVGSGYVGLVTGAGLAETGARVTCVDKDEAKIVALRGGEVPIYEPGLEELVERNVEADRLAFTTDLPGALRDADVVFVAVGTPQRADGGANLRAIDQVAEEIAAQVSRRCVLVIKSTVPVGTNARVRHIVREAAHPIHVVSNPEFLKEGAAVADFMRPDRIIIGCDPDDAHARSLMERVYHPVTLSGHRTVWMSPASAELTKYVANTMLAMRISFMNEVASLCEAVGADVHDVRKGVGSDRRIGSSFLYAGPGYGGSCFPKDVVALVHTARDHGVPMELASATDRVNLRQKGVLLRKLKRHLDVDLRNMRIAVWGLAFKPRTDDIRESPALTLVDGLLAEGAQVVVHDPEATDNFGRLYGDRVELAEDAYGAVHDADALVLVTEWRQYQNPDFEKLAERMRGRLLVDGRNIWSVYPVGRHGFTYVGIGAQGRG